jgi:hypothetical protein
VSGGRRSGRAHTGDWPGIGHCVWAMLGVRPLGHRGPAQKNGDIFDLFKKIQTDLN